MDAGENSNDKVIFIIGFLALIFALPTYQDYLKPVKLSFFSFNTSLYTLFLIMGCILFLSVYVYAIDNLKYCSFRIANFNLFAHTSLIADILYGTAILIFPIIIILLFMSSRFIAYVDSKNIDNQTIFLVVNLAVSISSLLYSVITVKSIYNKNVDRHKSNIEKASEFESDMLLRAAKMYDLGDYELMLMKLNMAIEKSLLANLAKKNLINYNKQTSLSELIKISEQENLINDQQKDLINTVRILRNKAAHSSSQMEIGQEEAKYYLREVQKLTSTLSESL